MGNFKIGEKVVFIHNDNCNYKPIPEINEIVTISYICKDGWIGLVGFYPTEYEPHHFRKLDYEFAENLLAEISEAMKSETIKN